jgi:hypothetical protein
MKSHLRKNERCPIHQTLHCCGRGRKDEKVTVAVQVMPDGRVICSEAERHRRKLRLLAEHPFCAVCEVLNPRNSLFTDFRRVHLGHRNSKGMNGSKHDDSWENLMLIHDYENIEMGSQSFEQYILKKQLQKKSA